MPETSKTALFVVDDDANQRALIAHQLSHLGYESMPFPSGEALLSGLASGATAEAVLLDVRMPGIGGLETLKRLKSQTPSLPVIVLTADNALDTIVQAMKLGAEDFIPKPADAQRLDVSLRNVLQATTLRAEVGRLSRTLSGRPRFSDILTRSPAMSAVLDQLKKAATSDITVLLLGESGTGKELMANAVHTASGRSSGPFVAVNCAAIPDTLVESLLFGHEKGAFTGATERRPGKFQDADGGTLFLDEIGDLKPDLQAKLLRALQEREVEPVGSRKAVPVNVRVIAATHQHLPDLVQKGAFRDDLYYRLSAFPVRLPPLRERRDDIPLLAAAFVERFSMQESLFPSRRLTPPALAVLMSRDWPGNVRELENTLHRAVVLSDAPDVSPALLEGVSLRLSRPEAAPLANPLLTLDQLEKTHIQTVLKATQGNMSQAASLLGISRNTLYRKTRDYGLTDNGAAE
jgi:DNA-binding NtrC family response regulator